MAIAVSLVASVDSGKASFKKYRRIALLPRPSDILEGASGNIFKSSILRKSKVGVVEPSRARKEDADADADWDWGADADSDADAVSDDDDDDNDDDDDENNVDEKDEDAGPPCPSPLHVRMWPTGSEEEGGGSLANRLR